MAGATSLFDALRLAARKADAPLLVALRDEQVRARVTAALAAEGLIVELGSPEEGLARLQSDTFALAVLEGDAAFEALRSCRGNDGADLVIVASADASLCGDAFAAGADALLPWPLPESDGLLRSHLRWLAACRRQRARARRVQAAFASGADALTAEEPLAAALREILSSAVREPAVLVIGDGELLRLAGGRAVTANPDAVVIGATAADEDLQARLIEARRRAGGAAVVVVDEAATEARVRTALLAGVRAFIDRTRAGALERLVARVAAKRRAELIGRRLVETLARFGALAEPGRAAFAPHALDARAPADAAPSAGPFVPSGHDLLVVDGDLVLLTHLREALRRGGYRVTTASSAGEAVDLMRRRSFDLVLADNDLPGAAGLELSKVARALAPPPAVVLMTGPISYDAPLDPGALDFIDKPIRDLERLRFQIRRALSRRDELLARRSASAGATDAIARLLFVEIEGDRRALMAEFLGRRYHVTAASDGEEALFLLRRGRYDLVLADRNLPGLSGLRVIEQAQRLLPHCASVLYTAYPSYDTVKAAFDAGVDAHLARPNDDLTSLVERIDGALRSRGGILLG